MGYRFGEGGLGVERGTLLKLFLRDNYSDGYSSVELQITECSLYKGGGARVGKGDDWWAECQIRRMQKHFFFPLFLFSQERFLR